VSRRRVSAFELPDRDWAVVDVPVTLDAQRDVLRKRNSLWEIWYVQRMVLGIVWCARRDGAALTDTVNADTPEHLQDEIDEVERQEGDHGGGSAGQFQAPAGQVVPGVAGHAGVLGSDEGLAAQVAGP
jgi:hypothetical protein